ncbi:MAG: TonB-dependent receptor [Acidobacteria bacterium]|nr:TonB-dependent receptor [Acidobacteriota bacterium]
MHSDNSDKKFEGIVTDAAGAAVPSATITVRNIETGSERQVTSDESGVYRAPLLPLGAYRLTVEAANFKRLVREGVTLTTGQTATVDLSLEAGDVSATVTITSDAPIADPGKIDVGRVMTTREVENLPLVSRNPYNYALLQANVTGRPNSEFGVPRINANGYARRTNYQLDGNNNTQADRSGIRLMPISETFISEVQLVTNGFSPEFGNTPGLIMNAVTPSGTNSVRGTVSYRFRRTPFYARPFQYPSPNDLPDNNVDNFTAAVGGPIIKDRWHIYGGYEYVNRDLAVEPGRIVNISAVNRDALIAAAVPSSAFVAAIPVTQKVNFYILRTDAQLTEAHRLTARYNYFGNNSPDNIGGGLNTLQRSINFKDKSYSLGLQLASTLSTNIINELRFQYSKRDSRFFANENSGTGPSIVISNVANFGAPEDDDTISPIEKMTQVQNNLTLVKGDHAIKVGGGFNRIYDFRRSAVFSRYIFSSIANYNLARNGTNPRAYTQYVEAFGDPEIEYNSNFWNFFAQDDWKVTPKLKLNYGVRYDLYDVPDADPNAPFEASRKFKVDKNNFAPRVGVVYGLRDGNRPTVIRASAGLYYDTPQLDMYRRALQNSGNPRFFNFTFSPTTPGAPAFPNTLGSLPAGTVLPRQSIETISPDFKSMYAMHANVQLEQGLTDDISVTVGYIHSNGRHIPVYGNINCIPTGATLPDGRLLYGSVAQGSCINRIFPQFQNILMVDSGGNSNYDAGTFQLTKRFSQGYQFSVNYTLSRSIDDAPEQNLVATTSYALSDPSNRRFDRGKSLADQTHTFIMSFVGRPTFDIENKFLRALINGNQLGIIVTANNGEVFNVVSSQDLNRDGVTGSDRPVGIERNAFRTPKQFNVDMRYSRFINFNERFRLELFAEAVNIFNINSIFQYNTTTLNTTQVNSTTGELLGPLPDFRLGNPPTSLDSRQLQLGFKFNF